MRLPPFLTGLGDRGQPYDPPGNWAVYASLIGDYMRRWLVRTPWGTLRLHRILRADDDRDLHDHPFDFTSLILRGGYTEVRVAGTDPDGDPEHVARTFRRGDVVRRRAEDLHAIRTVFPGTLTLVVSGTHRRKWGYQTTQGWTYWREYHRV